MYWGRKSGLAASRSYFETLEQRVCLATVFWSGEGNDGLWHDPGNWEGGVLPSPSDDVVIDVADNPTVRLTDATGYQTIRSLFTTEYIQAEGGTLEVLGAANVNARLNLTGGTLASGLWDFTGGDLEVSGSSGNRLAGPIEIIGDIDVSVLSGSRLTLGGGLALQGSIILGDNAILMLDGPQTLDGFTIRFIAYPGRGSEIIGQAFDSTGIVFGPTLKLDFTTTATNSIWVSSTGEYGLINEATIERGGSGGLLEIGGISFINRGILRASHGMLLHVIGEQWSNEGLIEAIGAHRLTLGRLEERWTNNGIISVTNTELNLDGYTTTKSLHIENIVNLASEVNITGTIDNSGATLRFDQSLGNWTLWGGRIIGGTIEQIDGGSLDFRGGTLVGPMDVLGDVTSDSFGGVRLTVETGIRFHGTVWMSNTSSITFNQSQEVETGTFRTVGTGTARFYLEGGFDALVSFGSAVELAVGEGMHFLIKSINAGREVLVNAGSLLVQGTDAVLDILAFDFTNTGEIAALDGGLVFLDSWTWLNTGTVVAQDGLIQIGGNVTTLALGIAGFDTAAGSVQIVGIIDNTDSSLYLGQAAGSWTLNGGTIHGGDIYLEPGTRLIAGASDASVFEGPITIHGTLDVATVLRGKLRIRGGLDVDGTMRVGNNAQVYFEGTQTLERGRLFFTGGGSYSNVYIAGSDDVVLTLGSEVVVERGSEQGTAAIRDNGSGTQSLVNYGTIIANADGLTLEVKVEGIVNEGALITTNGSRLIIGDRVLTNHGTITVDHGILDLIADTTTADLSAGFVRDGGEVNIFGKIDNRNDTLILDATTGSWNLVGGRIYRGAVVMRDGARLVIAAGLNSRLMGPISIQGVIDVAAVEGGELHIQGELDLDGTLLVGRGASVYFEVSSRIQPALLNGVIELMDLGAPSVLLVSGSDGTILTLGAGVVLRGAHTGGGQFQSVGSGTQSLVNEGHILVEGAASRFSVATDQFTNVGTVEARSGGALELASATNYDPETYTLTGGTWVVGQQSALTLDQAIIRTIGPGAHVLLDGNDAEFGALADSINEVYGTLELAGERQMNVTPEGGLLTNNGAIKIGPGSKLTVMGNYFQGASGLLASAATELDGVRIGELVVSGSAQLQGAFAMEFVDIAPPEGTFMDVLQAAGGVTGQFDEVVLPDAPDGDKVALVYEGNRVRVLTTDIADLDLDGLVDTRDFILYLSLWASGDPDADMNGDGVVDSRDFIEYLNHWANG